MANSSYYYNLYKQKKSAVNSYDDDLKDLRKALSNLTDTMSDEIRAINNELDDLKSDLNKSIRHNSKFTSRANAVTTEKEKTEISYKKAETCNVIDVYENFNNETIVKIAKKYNKTSAQIILRWQLQAGYIAIPGSKNPNHIKENISIFDFKLSDEDMKEIYKINENRRYENW